MEEAWTIFISFSLAQNQSKVLFPLKKKKKKSLALKAVSIGHLNDLNIELD